MRWVLPGTLHPSGPQQIRRSVTLPTRVRAQSVDAVYCFECMGFLESTVSHNKFHGSDCHYSGVIVSIEEFLLSQEKKLSVLREGWGRKRCGWKDFPEEKFDVHMSSLPRVSHIVDCSLIDNLYETLLEKCIEIPKLSGCAFRRFKGKCTIWGTRSCFSWYPRQTRLMVCIRLYEYILLGHIKYLVWFYQHSRAWKSLNSSLLRTLVDIPRW